MEIEGVQDLDERLALIRAEVQADMADREAKALRAAADAVAGPTVGVTGVRGWLNGPMTSQSEGRARAVALACAALPVLAVIIAVILAA